MSFKHFATVALGVSLAACGASKHAGPSEATHEQASSAASAAVTAGAALSASAMATGAATTAPSATPDAAARPCHFAAWAGPKFDAKALTAQKVWALVPVGLDCDYGVAKLAMESYGRPAGKEQVLVAFDQKEMFVPAALVQSVEPAKKLKKGDAVMADVAAASGYGRVVEVVTTEGQSTIKLKYMWGGSVSDTALEPSAVIKLDDKLSFGAPIGVKTDDGWDCGTLLVMDEKAGWYLGFAGSLNKADIKNIKPMKVSKAYKKGDKVWAKIMSRLNPATVVEVLDGGVGYKVRGEKESKDETVGLEDLTSPLK